VGWSVNGDYTLVQDMVFGSELTVIEVVPDTEISQTVTKYRFLNLW
jgi:hypothetical protein